MNIKLLVIQCLTSVHDATKNKPDSYRSKDCMERFCKDWKEHVRKLTNYEKKEMISLTNKEKELYNKQKVCYICKKEFIIDDDNKKYHKVRGHCH